MDALASVGLSLAAISGSMMYRGGSSTAKTIKPDYGKKFDYLFGKATGSKHNIDRSVSMEKQLNSVGIFDNKTGRGILETHLTKTFNDKKSVLQVQDNGRTVRESLLVGPNGSVKIESIWDNEKLITAKIYGGK